MTSHWTAEQIGDQSGRTAVITGGNTGIGFETARVLAARGATVVLACRDPEKAATAAARIEDESPGSRVDTLRLDLASLASVRTAAAKLRTTHPRIDLLINNAGVMMTPRRATEDGFELQFGVNHLGHFALTGLLLDRVLPVVGARVVTVSSIAHTKGDIAFDDIHSRHRYSRFDAYAQSKLANLLFTYELQRRLTAAGTGTIAVAAHPGITRTQLTRYLPAEPLWRMFLLPLGHSVQMGSLAVLRAATDPAAVGGDYYAPPPGRLRSAGFPIRSESSDLSRDRERQLRLWAESERLTGVTYPAPVARP